MNSGVPRFQMKPFKDWIPQVNTYSGEANRAPEAFLAQFRLYARHNSVPDTERARQLIGKFTQWLCPAVVHPHIWERPYEGHRGPDLLRSSSLHAVRSGVCWCPHPQVGEVDNG